MKYWLYNSDILEIFHSIGDFQFILTRKPSSTEESSREPGEVVQVAGVATGVTTWSNSAGAGVTAGVASLAFSVGNPMANAAVFTLW